MGIVTSVNHTLSHEVSRLRVLMKSLLTEVKKHVVSKFLPFLPLLNFQLYMCLPETLLVNIGGVPVIFRYLLFITQRTV